MNSFNKNSFDVVEKMTAVVFVLVFLWFVAVVGIIVWGAFFGGAEQMVAFLGKLTGIFLSNIPK